MLYGSYICVVYLNLCITGRRFSFISCVLENGICHTKVISISVRSADPSGLRRQSWADRLLGLLVRIPPGAWTSVSCEYCVLCRSLCDGPLPRPEESYRLWCVMRVTELCCCDRGEEFMQVVNKLITCHRSIKNFMFLDVLNIRYFHLRCSLSLIMNNKSHEEIRQISID